MKRAIQILVGLSLVTALVVFLVRRGQRDEASSAETEPQSSAAVAAHVPALAPLPPPVFVRPEAGAAPPAAPEVSAEELMLRDIRNLVRTDPAKAVALARESRQRFGDSDLRMSDDRDSFLIQGLLNMHDMAAARAEMPYYYRHHPQGRWADYLFALTVVGPNSPPP